MHLFIFMIEEKVYYRYIGRHSQRQEHLGECKVDMTRPSWPLRGQGPQVQQPGGQRYKKDTCHSSRLTVDWTQKESTRWEQPTALGNLFVTFFPWSLDSLGHTLSTSCNVLLAGLSELFLQSTTSAPEARAWNNVKPWVLWFWASHLLCLRPFRQHIGRHHLP